MWHTTYTQLNQGDFRLFLMGENQIDTLILGLSFGHNLCFKYSNVLCKPTLTIHVSRPFQWYNELFNPMICLALEIAFWKFKSSLGLQLPKWKPIWECVGSFLHILLHSWGSIKCDFRASLLTRTFANPCFGHEPKAKVAIVHPHASLVLWASQVFFFYRYLPFLCISSVLFLLFLGVALGPI
jgi:hypothetical protein